MTEFERRMREALDDYTAAKTDLERQIAIGAMTLVLQENQRGRLLSVRDVKLAAAGKDE